MDDKILRPYKGQKLRTASEVADALVNHAKLKSEQMLVEANHQASLLAKQAEQSGLEIGQKKAFANIITGESLLDEVLDRSKHIVIQLAIEIAKEILIQELTINPRSISSRVDNLVNKTLSARKIKISVHPSIVDEIRETISSYPESERMEIIADAKLELADVKVSTEIGEVTSKLEVELDEISLALAANTSRIFK